MPQARGRQARARNSRHLALSSHHGAITLHRDRPRSTACHPPRRRQPRRPALLLRTVSIRSAMALSKPEAAPLAEDRQSGRQEAGRKAGAIRVSMGGPQDETPTGKENPMPIYVTLLQYTEKGVHHVKDTVKREEAFKSRAKKHGVTVKEIDLDPRRARRRTGFRGPRRRDRYSCHLERGRTGQCSHRDHARLHGCRDGKVTGKGRLATCHLARVPERARVILLLHRRKQALRLNSARRSTPSIRANAPAPVPPIRRRCTFPPFSFEPPRRTAHAVKSPRAGGC